MSEYGHYGENNPPIDAVWHRAARRETASDITALQARNAQLRRALELADAALSGANMDMAHVERRVKAALAQSLDEGGQG